jgi:hypothetical protein
MQIECSVSISHHQSLVIVRVEKMASQRITVAKVGGAAGELVMLRLREWASAIQTEDRNEWSKEQWPVEVRRQADAFAERLRSHALSPPVIYFAEWADLWSMGDLFIRLLTPPGQPPPLVVHSERFEVYGYPLPDSECLAQHLVSATPQQFVEYDWLVWQLRQAEEAWNDLVDTAALVVLREVVGGLVIDDELRDSLSLVPDWLREI